MALAVRQHISAGRTPGRPAAAAARRQHGLQLVHVCGAGAHGGAHLALKRVTLRLAHAAGRGVRALALPQERPQRGHVVCLWCTWMP